MNIRKIILISCLSLFICFCLAKITSSDPLVGTRRTVIKKVGHFPGDQDIEKGVFLKNVGPICLDSDNNIVVGDWNYCVFYKIDKNGLHIGSFGKRGQGPKELQSVHYITPYKNGYICIDSGNMRIVYLDKEGNVIKSIKIFKTYKGIAASYDGKEFYLPPRLSDDILIDVMDDKGDIINSFGDRLIFANKHTALNEIILRNNSKGEIWAAWKYFPLLRRYNQKGEKLAEYKIEDKSINEITKRNELASKSKKNSNSIDLMGIINCFAVSDTYYYMFLLGNDKPRIVEYSYEGRVNNIYEIADNLEKVIYVNMVVMEKNTERTFYLVQGFPDAGVDIYKIENKSN